MAKRPSPTEAPATEAPATEAPATEAPATEAPATEAHDNRLLALGDGRVSAALAAVEGMRGEAVAAAQWPVFALVARFVREFDGAPAAAALAHARARVPLDDVQRIVHDDDLDVFVAVLKILDRNHAAREAERAAIDAAASPHPLDGVDPQDTILRQHGTVFDTVSYALKV